MNREEENKKNVLNYFDGDDLASSTFFNKYAKGDLDNPDELHERMAEAFYNVEKKYPRKKESKNISSYGVVRNDLDKETIKNLFKNFKYVIPAGSVMAGIGSKKPVSLSNCFVIGSPKDSYTEIMKTRTEQTCLTRRRGGVGYDLSNLRPRGSKVNNAAKTSTGAASFMEVCSAITNETAQNGRRKSVLNY